MTLVVARRAALPSDVRGLVGDPAGDTVAKSAEVKPTPDLKWIAGAYVLIIAAAFIGWGLWNWIDPNIGAPAAGFAVFAPMYILAQGIERLLEPFTNMLGPAASNPDEKTTTVKKDDAVEKRDAAFAALATTLDDNTALKAANWQATVDKIRRNTAVIAWGTASALAIVACGAFGIRLLLVTGFHIRPFWDIFLTGLAIGSGTKPLHDLISNIQKAKDDKSNPPGVATAG